MQKQNKTNTAGSQSHGSRHNHPNNTSHARGGYRGRGGVKSNFEKVDQIRGENYVLKYVPSSGDYQEPHQSKGKGGAPHQRANTSYKNYHRDDDYYDYDDEEDSAAYSQSYSRGNYSQKQNRHTNRTGNGGANFTRYHEETMADDGYSNHSQRTYQQSSHNQSYSQSKQFADSRGGTHNRRGGATANGGHSQYQVQIQPSRGRGRAANLHSEDQIDHDLDYQPVQRARIAYRGRGRGRGGDHIHQDKDFNGFGQPVDFQETRTRPRGRGRGRGQLAASSNRDYSNQWVKDEEYDEEEVEMATHHQRDGGHEGQFDFQDGENYAEASAADDEIFQPKYFLNDQRDVEELFEEKCILDKRSMQLINEYNLRSTSYGRQQSTIGHTQEAYIKPEFYQGPQYVMYKQLTSQNRKQRIQSSEMGDIQFQNKEKFERDQLRSHMNPWDRSDSESSHGIRGGGMIRNQPAQTAANKQEGGKSRKDHKKPKNEVYGQDFDFKAEKRSENRFWNDAFDKNKTKSGLLKEIKDNKKGATRERNPRNGKKVTRNGAYQNGKKQFKSEASKDEIFARKNGKEAKKRELFANHLSQQQVEEGLNAGFLFEGILRVNPNNRKRAFVTVSDLKVDVMVDGFVQQNRALDGDVVVLQLLQPNLWPKHATGNNIVVKGDKGGAANALIAKPSGYTNETAVERRIIDDDLEEIMDQEEEIKEIEREILQKEARSAEHSDNDSEGSSSRQSHSSKGSKNAAKRLNFEEEEKQSSKQLNQNDEEDDVGYGMLDDEEVNSSSDEESEKEAHSSANSQSKPNKQLEMIKEESTRSAKKERTTQQVKSKKSKYATQGNQLHIPSFFKGKTKQQIIQEINDLALELRPLGEVKAIKQSNNFEKEHLVTFIRAEKKDLDDQEIERLADICAKKKNACSSGIYAVPVSKKLPWMAIIQLPQELIKDIKDKKKLNQRYYIVKIKQWSAHTLRPACEVICQIGEAGNLDAESMRLLKMHEIYSDEYETQGQSISQKVDESLRIFTKHINPETNEWIIPQEEIARRVDLRQKRIFTIDPITAKDLDDALSIDKVSDFIYEIGVHIADVSYFVQQGTELDKEAQLRCTSVYFVHKVYPMLPRLLCERLCSLNPRVDRLAYSIFFRMDIRSGEVDRSYTPRICRTVIRSCAKWHYQMVQDILDGKISNESQLEDQYKPVNGVKFSEMRSDCFLMNEIAQKRRMKRLENGSILLQNREFCFQLDQETRMPLDFTESYRIESKFLVEEYMLLANILIAEHLHQYCKDKTLLRVHPDVEDEKKEKLKEFFSKVGLEGIIDLTDSQTLSESLEKLRETGDTAKFNVAMRKFLTCLQCAKYMCINQSAEKEYMHFGLNFPLYTHFTSPIRRYADLLVHRLITLTLQHQDATRNLIELMDYSNYAEMCSEKSLNAKRASQACSRLFHCLLLKKNGVKVFETLLFDMDHGTISIYLDEVNMHQKLRLRDDPRIDSLIFFEEQMIMVAHLKPKDAKNSNKIEENKSEENKEESKANKKPKNGDKKQRETNGDRLDKFKKAKSLSEIQLEFDMSEYIILRIFDKVKVKVDTTVEFPLDIVCSLVISPEDHEEYDQLLKKQEEEIQRKSAQARAALEQSAVGEEAQSLNDEI